MPITQHMDSSSVEQFAWLYTRGNQSVHLSVHRDGTVYRLLINGPGHSHQAQDFADLEPLRIFAREFQDRLVADSYQLQAFAERRSGDRAGGGSPGPAPQRRRR